MNRALVWWGLVAASACAAPPPFHVDHADGPGGTRLTLVARPGARVNARLLPALELSSGSVLRFQGAADSAYFTAAPTVTVPAGVHQGLVRASVCPAEQAICRSYAVALQF